MLPIRFPPLSFINARRIGVGSYDGTGSESEQRREPGRTNSVRALDEELKARQHPTETLNHLSMKTRPSLAMEIEKAKLAIGGAALLAGVKAEKEKKDKEKSHDGSSTQPGGAAQRH